MDWDTLTRLLTAVALALGIANTAWVWLSKGGKELAEKLETASEDLSAIERRVQTIEGELKHLPSKDDIAAMRLEIEKLSGRMGAFDTELAAVSRTARRIEDILLGKSQ